MVNPKNTYPKGFIMPLYTIVNKKTKATQTMMCSYVSLEEKLKELGDEWSQEIGAPAIVSTTGNVVNKTSSDWKNHLTNIRKGAGRGSNIKT